MSKSINILGEISKVDNISEEERNDQIVASILSLRGITSIDEFVNPSEINRIFLQKAQELFSEQFLPAIVVIQNAIKNNQSIVIHGDYDVDGVSSTAILWETIYYDLGYKNVFPFIPHRVDHGYGVSVESVNQIVNELEEKKLTSGLLITVDCGITANDSISYAKEKGFTVILSDHHTLPEHDLPSADYIVHTYKMCAAGIAWVIARSLVDDNYFQGVDLVALATLADLQPLTEFNRSFVKFGLNELTNTKRLGLQKLCEVAGISGKPIGTYEVGWIIGPRLNATGRLEHALDALRLLVVKNDVQALEMAKKLNALNFERQRMTQTAVDQAITMVEEKWNKNSPIIVASVDWHEGIIGLIAGKICEKYQVPVIAIAISNEIAKGSARSISGVNIISILRTHEDLFTNMGGHAGAAGFSIQIEKIAQLQEQIASMVVEFDTNLTIEADLELKPEWITFALYEKLAQLEPFGIGNPRPVFYTPNLKVSDVRTVGKNQEHLAINFSNGLRGIGFNLSDQKETIQDQVSLTYNIDEDTYRGNHEVQLKIKEII